MVGRKRRVEEDVIVDVFPQTVQSTVFDPRVGGGAEEAAKKDVDVDLGPFPSRPDEVDQLVMQKRSPSLLLLVGTIVSMSCRDSKRRGGFESETRKKKPTRWRETQSGFLRAGGLGPIGVCGQSTTR